LPYSDDAFSAKLQRFGVVFAGAASGAHLDPLAALRQE
jgi:hypothetical protein